jgi:Peptidase family S41/PDZ domain
VRNDLKKAIAPMMALVAALGLSLTVALPTAQASTLNEDVTNMLSAMKSVYSTRYAPIGWKKQYAGYDLGVEYSKAVNTASTKSALSIAETRPIFNDFIYAMKDYHVSITYIATEQASLPLMVRGAEGRLFIVFIDRSKLSETAFPFAIGDELIAIDGIPANQVVDQVQATYTPNVAETDRAQAEIRLFNRRASRGLTVPNGPVTLTIKRKGAAAPSSVQLVWDYVPEKIPARGDLMHGTLNFASGSKFHPQMSVDLDSSPSAAENPFNLGTRQSFMPALGRKIWESPADNSFHAYLFQDDNKKIVGYVRIPSYSPAGGTAKAALDFAAIIPHLEANAESLVIDQVNNPGGSVFYLYALVSMLSDRPMATPRHRMAISQSDVAEALTTLEQLKAINTEDDVKKFIPADYLSGYPVTLETVRFMQSYAQFIVDEWTQGRKLTKPYWIAGVDHINPSPVRFTKPILLLVNELDFSGGDFFPTIMQDNQRVTVMGTRTAGAGGYVVDVSVPNNVGIATFRVTESIAERVTGKPIENLGVTPDIGYSLTAEDYTSNFAPYVKAVKDALKSITP